MTAVAAAGHDGGRLVDNPVDGRGQTDRTGGQCRPGSPAAGLPVDDPVEPVDNNRGSDLHRYRFITNPQALLPFLPISNSLLKRKDRV
jgi:hypothetical protein